MIDHLGGTSRAKMFQIGNFVMRCDQIHPAKLINHDYWNIRFPVCRQNPSFSLSIFDGGSGILRHSQRRRSVLRHKIRVRKQIQPSTSLHQNFEVLLDIVAPICGKIKSVFFVHGRLAPYFLKEGRKKSE